MDLTALLRVEDAVSKVLCREDNKILLKLCVKLISLAVGRNQKEIQIDTVSDDCELLLIEILNMLIYRSKKILPNLMKYLSTRVSIMQLTHYYQNMINDNFRQFDHKKSNLKIYKSTMPPEYALQNIVAPTFLYHAAEDRYASVKVKLLAL